MGDAHCLSAGLVLYVYNTVKRGVLTSLAIRRADWRDAYVGLEPTDSLEAAAFESAQIASE